jgi:hypothetical protein
MPGATIGTSAPAVSIIVLPRVSRQKVEMPARRRLKTVPRMV